jgi:hypothetical protein
MGPRLPVGIPSVLASLRAAGSPPPGAPHVVASTS